MLVRKNFGPIVLTIFFFLISFSLLADNSLEVETRDENSDSPSPSPSPKFQLPWEPENFFFKGEIECTAENCFNLKQTVRHALIYSIKNKIQFAHLHHAKVNIVKKIGRILPRIEFSIGHMIRPKEWVDLFGGLLGFLIPKNWFNLHESKLLYQAEKYATISRLKDCMLATETLYYHIHKFMMDYEISKYYNIKLTDIVNYVDQNYDEMDFNKSDFDMLKVRFGNYKSNAISMSRTIKQILPEMAKALMLFDDDWMPYNFGIDSIELPDLSEKEPIGSNIKRLKKIIRLITDDNEIDIKILKKYKQAAVNNFASGFTGFIEKGKDSNKSLGINIGLNYFTNFADKKTTIHEKKLDITDFKSEIIHNMFRLIAEYDTAIESYKTTKENFKFDLIAFDRIRNTLSIEETFSARHIRQLLNYHLENEFKLNAATHAYLIAKAEINDLINRRKHFSNLEKYFPNAKSLKKFKKLVRKEMKKKNRDLRRRREE